MWAKILAGVVAAVAVVGLGVYVALPSGADGGSCGKCSRPAETSADLSGLCPTNAGGCCATAEQVDALAACGGGLTAAAVENKFTCCSE
jgi:hypothetical protein